MKQLNQEAASKFCWPVTTSFHGTHNFRHGASQDAFAEGGTKLVMIRTGHLSQQCAMYYARSDLERSLKGAQFAKSTSASQAKQIGAHIRTTQAAVDKIIETRKVDGLNKLNTDNKLSPRLNLAHQEEAELLVLKEHVRKQQDYCEQDVMQRRRRGRHDSESKQKETVNMFDLPEHRLMVPLDKCFVISLAATVGGSIVLQKHYVPNAIRNQVSAGMTVKYVSELTAKYHRQNQPLPPDTPRQDILDRNLYPGLQRTEENEKIFQERAKAKEDEEKVEDD